MRSRMAASEIWPSSARSAAVTGICTHASSRMVAWAYPRTVRNDSCASAAPRGEALIQATGFS